MRKLTIPLMALVALMFLPFSAFAQTDPSVEDNIFSFMQVLPDGTILDSDGNEIIYEKNWFVTEDDNTIQVQLENNKLVFDKNTSAVTIFDDDTIAIKSDSYVVRGAPLNTDNWTNLNVNDSPVTYTISQQEYNVIITFTKENNEGKFDVETIVGNEHSKTTAKFTNYIYEDYKFSFTETIELDDNIIKLNSQDIDLSLYSGQSFTREVLEENLDLFLEAKQVYFNAGLGFEYLWQVNVHENNTISLDWANVGQTHTPIGQTVELDPTYSFTIGTGSSGWSNSQFYRTSGVTTDSNDRIIIADKYNHRVQVFDSSGNYQSTIGGNGSGSGNSQFKSPTGVTTDSNDRIIVADTSNHRVQIFDSVGNYQSTIGGNGYGSSNSQFYLPKGVATDSNDRILVADYYNHRVQIFDSNGTYQSTIGTTGNSGSSNSQFSSPYGITTDSNDRILVVDTINRRVQVFDSSGNYQSTIGTGYGSGNYQSKSPYGVGTDSNDNIFVADHDHHRVQVFNSSGTYQYTIGLTGSPGSSNSQFRNPTGVTTDSNDRILVADTGNHRVQVFVTVTPPSSPTNLTTTQNTANQIELNWTSPSSGSAPTSYEIYANSVLVATTGNVVTYTHNIPSNLIGTQITYMVEAINSAGSATSNNSIITSWDVPDAPTAPSATFVSNTSNTITWTAPSSNGSAITDYELFRNGNSIGNVGNVLTYTDTGLTIGSSNFYSVKAINAVGASSLSSNSNTILNATPPSAPTNLAATTTDPIVLTWTASPDPDPSSPVLHYSIERSTDGTNWTTLSANVGNVVTYTDNTTTAGTIYHYQVSAVTNAGAGPASTPTSASAGTVSTPPQTLAVTQTTVGQLDLSWAAPNDDGSTGGITGYKVYRDGVVIATLGNVLVYNDATIAAGTQYTYTVTALNAAGESTVSNGIVTTTWAVPDAPTGATASGGIPIVVNWNTPNSDSPITDYKVYRDGSLLTTILAPTLTYSDSSVTPNTTYSYTISAVSAVGEGAQSTSTSGQSGVPPAQITTFTATPVDSSRIKLDWAAPNDNGYTITSYKIYKGGNLVGTTAGLTYTDTGLQNNTTYSYTVTAVNVGGEGTQSAAQSATTSTPLSPPTNVYTEEHVTSVTVTWDKVIGAVSYTVERDGVTLGTTTDFWYVDSTAAASTSYSYKVYANSSAVNGLNGTTSAVTTASATSHQYITVTPTAPNANAYPIDMYELHRNGVMVGYLEPNNLVYEDHDVSIGTTYTYQVRAHNLLGWSQLSPVGSVTTWNVPDVITTLSGSVGSPIVLNWSAPNSDKPITLYTIYRDGSLLATTTNLTYSDTSVTSGTTYVYTVTATNVIGEGIQSAGLSLQAGTVPTIPQNNAVTAQAGNNILFSWQAPSSNGGVPITGYNPQVSTDGGTTWTNLLSTPTTALSFTHTGLITGQNYSYQVNAINAVGNSPYTSTISVIAGDVPSQVTGLSTTAVSDTEIDLTWNVPANNAYSVSSYNILRSTDGITWTALTSNTNSYSDTGLTADTNYTYKVSAVNTLGTGIESSTVQQRTFGLPDPITTITLSPQSTTQINLNWTQPNLNGFSLVGYTVQQSTDSGATWTTLSTQTSTTYSATALTQNTVYNYRINTENSFGSIDGTSNAATTYPITTNLISGVTQSDTEIQVTWNAIAGNGAVQYSLERSADSGVTWTPATIYLTSTTYTDTGLTPLTDYNYRVTSVNSAGLSSPSIPSNTVTTFGPSDAPTNLTLTALLNAEIQLDWSTPTVTNGGPITGYNIERSTNGSTWSVVANNTSGLTYTDTGLTTSQVYHYRVSAINAYGISAFSASANAMASDVPSQVTGLTAIPLTNYEIQLNWTAPNANGYPISGYTIERSTDAGTTWNVLVTDTQNTNITYTDINLTVSQTYHYRVSAINQVGTGTASAVANTQAGSIPDAPTMTLTALPNNSIQLDWTTPINNGFVITTYQIEKSIDNGITWTSLTSSNTNTTQDTGLINGNSYQYRVLATNQIGNSAFSSAVSMISGDIPSQVTGLTATTTSNTSIDLAWTAPNDNGYAISGYMIERSTDNGVTWSTLVADTQSLTLVYSDTGLTTGTYYTYKISAINSLGTGQASATSTSHAGDVPDATVLTATPTTAGQINLSWTVPNDNGFTNTKYLIERSTDGITYVSIMSIVPSTGTTTHTDTGIVGTLYYYKITTENAIGFSPDSNVESLNAGDIPGVITNLAGTTQSDTQINLTWTAPNTNGYPVTGYKIEQSVDNVTWNVIVPDTQTAQTSHTVSGLTEQTDYYYRISGINTIGSGPVSNTASLHTFGPPEPISAISGTATNISTTLTWTAPYDHGSTITGYKVEVQDFVTGNWLNLATVTTTTYTQINMIPNTQYEYRVTSINPYGTSYSPNVVVSTLANTPGTPTVTVISGTELKVEWAAVAGTGITYTIYTSSDDITYTAGPVGHPTAYFDHQGLTNGQTVYYKVAVLNSSGESAQSPSAVGTTYTTPDAPTNIQVTHSTPLSATITWTAPANDGGDPNNLSYTLQRSNDNANWASIVPTTGLTATDTPLTPGTQYYWRVNSVNTAGIGGTSGTVNYLAPSVPSSPTGLTASLVGSTNSAGTLNWGAPTNTSGFNVIGYQIERNDDGAGWVTIIADTGNSNLAYTNTGLNAGVNYVYRVSAITAVGIGSASNTASIIPVLATVTITGQVTGGNSVVVTPVISVTGGTSSNVVLQSLYKDNARDQIISLSTPLTSGALTSMTSYPTQTSSFFVTITLDTGYIIQSNTLALTPSAPFTGDISFSEERNVYEGATAATDCANDGGNWITNTITGTSSCDLSYTESTLDFTVQPVGADVIIRYQPQNLNEEPIIKAFTATSTQISEDTAVDPDTDYYGSIYVNPEFDYTVQADNTIVVNCDPNDILCDPNDVDVPKGTPSEKTFKSFKSPDATPQLGIEPMGDLFGVNMIFIFVIAVAGIFTGRSAPMGVIFIVVTMGIMSYLGYLDFYSPDATWALLIIAAILGIFIGKRWS